LKNIKLTIIFFNFSGSIAQTFSTDPCFSLIFQDNFTTLNTANWAVQNRASWTNTQTWDLPANVTIQNNDFLRILLERRLHHGLPFCGGEITSNTIYSLGIYI